ncbi:MAG: outer membrane beta-barrel protein [Ignavibacteriales bacterium]|nr:outer membrane beta-barrel protein [Ignavibacteriales bacterium]
MKTTTLRILGIFLAVMLVASVGKSQMRSNKFGVGASGSYFLLQSDYDKADPSFGGGVELSYSLMEYLSVRSSLGVAFLQASNPLPPSLKTTIVFGNLYLAADLIPHGDVNPFIFAGGSGMYFDPRTGSGVALTGDETKQMKGTVVGGIGFDFFVSEFFSFTVMGEYALPFSDRIDGRAEGTKKDSFQRISLGVRYYFFDQEFITRLLKALEERYK